MKNKTNHPSPEEAEMWSKLLSPLRVEPTPEADFEARFIEEFHRRLQQESARVTPMARFLDRVKFFMTDFAGRRWAAVATTVLVMAFVLGALMWPQADVPKAVASVGTPVKQVAQQQRRVVADIAPTVIVAREAVMPSKVIDSIHEEEEKKEEENPAQITPVPAAE